MRYAYLFAIFIAVLFLVYQAGMAQGRQKCRADSATVALRARTESAKQQERINAETFNRGLGDIRRVLRTKYTIAE